MLQATELTMIEPVSSGWFQWAARPPAPEAVAPAYWAVPPGGGDVEARAGGRGSARPNRTVPPALEPGPVVAPGRYRPHYRSPLEPVGGSALSKLLIGPFEFKFDRLNMNSTV
jgi:hypothetical protein